MSLSKHISQTFISKIGAFLLVFVGNIFLTRMLGPEGKGVQGFVAANAALLAMLLGFNLNRTLTYFIAKKEEDQQPQVIGFGLLLSVIGWGLFVTVSLVLYSTGHRWLQWLLPKDWLGPIALGLLLARFSFLLFGNGMNGVWQGQRKFGTINLQLLVNSGLQVLIYGGAWLYAHYYGYHYSVQDVLLLIILAISLQLLVKLSFLLMDRPRIRFARAKLVRPMLSFGLVGMATGLLNFANRRIDVWFVEYYDGLEQLGYYILAASLVDILINLMVPAIQVMSPYITKAGFEQGVDLLGRFSRLIIWMALLGLGGLALVAGLFVPLLYGTAFQSTVWPLRILCVGMFFIMIRNVFSMYNVATNRQRFNLYANIIAFGVTIALDFLLIPHYGIVGASWASVGAYATSSLFVMGTVMLYTRKSPLYYFVITKTDINQLRQQIRKRLL